MKLRVVGALAIALSGGLALPGLSVAGDGAVLRISATGTDIAKLDPHRATSTTDKAAVDWMFNGLVRFPPGSADPKDIEPDLAESWETLGRRQDLDVPPAQGRRLPRHVGSIHGRRRGLFAQARGRSGAIVLRRRATP